jgi:hypothetical protein
MSKCMRVIGFCAGPYKLLVLALNTLFLKGNWVLMLKAGRG